MRKDRTLEKIIKQVAVEHSLSEKTVEDIIEHMFSQTRKTLGRPEMPGVLLHNFGKFEVKLGRINGVLRRAFINYRKGHMSREKLKKTIQKLWPIRRRLQIETRWKTQD